MKKIEIIIDYIINNFKSNIVNTKLIQNTIIDRQLVNAKFKIKKCNLSFPNHNNNNLKTNDKTKISNTINDKMKTNDKTKLDFFNCVKYNIKYGTFMCIMYPVYIIVKITALALLVLFKIAYYFNCKINNFK